MDGCDGYATRYWDCCKPHCGWDGNVPDAMTPVSSCDQSNARQGGNYGEESSCNNATADASVGAKLAYGFAAVPSNGDICGRC